MLWIPCVKVLNALGQKLQICLLHENLLVSPVHLTAMKQRCWLGPQAFSNSLSVTPLIPCSCSRDYSRLWLYWDPFSANYTHSLTCEIRIG